MTPLWDVVFIVSPLRAAVEAACALRGSYHGLSAGATNGGTDRAGRAYAGVATVMRVVSVAAPSDTHVPSSVVPTVLRW